MNADKINKNVESRLTTHDSRITIHSFVEPRMNAGKVETKKSD